MNWGKFLTALFIVYFIYYGLMVILDLIRGAPGQALAADGSAAIDITGYDDDHVAHDLNEFSEPSLAPSFPPASLEYPITQQTPPELAKELQSIVHSKYAPSESGYFYGSLNEKPNDLDESDAAATIMHPIISKGCSLQELANAHKASTIELCKGISF